MTNTPLRQGLLQIDAILVEPYCAGHSLGGAVAILCAIRLLRQLPMRDDLPVGCITFACPTIGNAALAALASSWTPYLRNYLLPGTITTWLSGLKYVYC